MSEYSFRIQEEVNEKNQRLYPRRAAFVIAEYELKEGSFRDLIRNKSADGLFVRTWRTFVAEEPIVLKFPLFRFDNTIQVFGKVVRNDHDGFAVAFVEPIEGPICKDGLLPEIVHEGQRNEYLHIQDNSIDNLLSFRWKFETGQVK